MAPTPATAETPHGLRLTPRQQELAADHVLWVRRFARRFARRFPWLTEDLMSAALLGLCHAARSYEPDRNPFFKPLAAVHVRGAMSDLLRHQFPQGYRRKNSVHPDRIGMPGTESSADSEALDIVAPDGPVGWELESADTVASVATRWLSRPYAKIIIMLYLNADTATKADVGKHLGCCGENICIIHKKAISVLRKLADAGRIAS